MRIRVLGTAAGGGFPQWNCGCDNCAGVRAGRIAAAPRLHESIAVSAGRDWLLVNASPDVRQQIESTPELHPRARRDSPLAAIALTNGDVDHCLGLLALREWQPLVVLATERVWRGLSEHNVLWRTLERFPGQISWQRLEIGRPAPVTGARGDTGLVIEAFAVPGKLPVHFDGRFAPHPEDNVGLRLGDGERMLGYVPAAGAITAEMRRALADASCVFFDGTFWSGDELVNAGLAGRTARTMAHLPVGGPDGSLEALAGVTAPHRFFTHLNNTQPLLRDDSRERAAVRARGWDVPRDGMELRV